MTGPESVDLHIASSDSKPQPKPRFRLQLRVSERRLLLMFGDALAILLSVFISLRIWALVAAENFDLNFVLPQVYWFFLLVFLWFFLAGANDFYNLRLTSQIGSSLARLVLITAQLLIIYLLIFFLSSRTALPRLFILYHAAISFVLLALWRAWRPFLIGWSGSRRCALIIGTGPAAETILQTMNEEAPKDYNIIGCIGSAGADNPPVGGMAILGTGADLPLLVERHQVTELIIAYGSELPGDVFQGIMTCYEKRITIIPMPLLYEQITGRVPIEHVGQQHWSVVLPLEGRSISFSLYMFLKRVMDITLALIGLACFMVILGPLVLIMTLDSRGSIFYFQERVGRGGKIFKVIKLRTMIHDAERDTGPQWATKGDPRITRVGRFCRKTRLDEVPQLINVLRGDMSFVGPRPERPFFVQQLTEKIPFYRTRLVVNPGLTGWAQVRYKYGNTTQDALVKLQYDLYYIRHQSLALDMMILLRTIGKVLSFQGT